ncbi:TPA: hypothetical protein SR713_002688, partial [Staphylococcus aureus]|nr:hypothetical protein [Staphylococcus aureus]
ELKEKGMFVIKKKDNNTYECSFYNPTSTNSTSNKESKISVTGYTITNQSVSNFKESDIHFELTK